MRQKTIIENSQEIVKYSFNIYDPIIKDTLNVMGDDIFPTLALHGFFPILIAIIFIIGLVSALFPSADGALTSLTSSFCVDILGLQKKNNLSENEKKKIRMKVHFAFTLLFFVLIMIFKWINDKSIIYLIMELAAYTYGPLLGLFTFGIFTKRQMISNNIILIICLISPILTFLFKQFIAPAINYNVGLELIVINGLITFIGLYIFSKPTISHKLA